MREVPSSQTMDFRSREVPVPSLVSRSVSDQRPRRSSHGATTALVRMETSTRSACVRSIALDKSDSVNLSASSTQGSTYTSLVRLRTDSTSVDFSAASSYGHVKSTAVLSLPDGHTRLPSASSFVQRDEENTRLLSSPLGTSTRSDSGHDYDRQLLDVAQFITLPKSWPCPSHAIAPLPATMGKMLNPFIQRLTWYNSADTCAILSSGVQLGATCGIVSFGVDQTFAGSGFSQFTYPTISCLVRPSSL